MNYWVTSLFKDIKEKVDISGHFRTAQSLVSAREYDEEEEEVPLTTDKSYDYYPSRLLPSELQLLVQYILRVRLTGKGDNLADVLGRLLFMEDLASDSDSSLPCLEMDMSKMGHACISVPLGGRSWPPEEGYTFTCWFQFTNLRSQPTENPGTTCLRLFSVRSTNNESTFYEELYLQEDGILTLTTSNANSVSSSSLELEEGQWYHLAVVHSKTKEDLTSIVHMYLNGKPKHTGELASAPFLIKNWQVTIGISAKHARASELRWTLRSCYLFDEKLSDDCIHFMYILGRGYKVLFRGLDNIHSNNETQSGDVISGANGTEAVWDLETLEKLWLELFGKKLICAFNAARIEALRGSETLALLNLVDPLSVAAPSVGVPLFGHFHGDIYICRRCVTGHIINPITEITVVLALIQTAETRDMLQIALKLLASALHQNPTNVQEMKTCRGYHLLSRFLHRKMSLFDIQSLHILCKIAVSEDSSKFNHTQSILPSSTIMPDHNDFIDADGYYDNIDNFTENKEKYYNNDDDLRATDRVAVKLISGTICDADILEHVLLDWNLWVTAPVEIQLSIVNFLEHMLSVYKYKDRNLAILRERNIVNHLLVTLHRDIVELPVFEKMVLLLCIILEDKFLDSELESMTRFVITTLDLPEAMGSRWMVREAKSKRVIFRNIFLEALIDLQVIIASEEFLEKWLSILSSTLITYFLDEVVHASTMVWIITLLGCCLTSSPSFSLKFHSTGGYQALIHILPHFHDSLDIYYALCCLMFGKHIYPKLPGVGIHDFESLMPTHGGYGELKFSGFLDAIIAMVKSSFNQPRVQASDVPEPVTAIQISGVSVEEYKGIQEEVSLEALMDRTLSAQLTDWEASAANAASVLRLMAILAKTWPSFSYTCGQAEFLESCVDLYFSIVRAYCAVKSGQESNIEAISSEFPTLASDDQLSEEKLTHQKSGPENSSSRRNLDTLLGIDDSGYSSPCTIGATAIIDLIAETLSDTLIRQINAVSLIESIFESVPLQSDPSYVLNFQAVCLDRVMNYLERRLLQDDEGSVPKLDTNSLWSNLGSFCNFIVDCVYLDVFSPPASVIRVLEFCFLMLHYAKKDGQMNETSLPWTGLLSILRGNRPFDAILKCTNRMILYCFLPSLSKEEVRVDICIVLELLHAHKQVIFHPSNLDSYLYASLCINLIALFSDHRKDAREASISIFKYLLVHCRASLETFLISKPDVLNGVFSKLLTENASSFMHLFQSSEEDIKLVLQQNAGIKWSGYIEDSVKFQGDRSKLLEEHRREKMTKKAEEIEKRDIRYREQCGERRFALEAIHENVDYELEVSWEKKSESGLNTESEWKARLQQLGHQHKLEPVSDMAWEDYWPLC